MCSGVITHVCGWAVSRTAVALSRVHRRLPGLTALNAVAAAGGRRDELWQLLGVGPVETRRLDRWAKARALIFLPSF